MSSLEHVALWLGLIVGVISVTLAIVSIVFTFHVDRRSNEISTRTLQSLEEIKNTGKETAAQVTNLVRSVVDRLFGIVEKPPVIQEATSIQQVSSGLAAEVQANIEKELGVDRIPELERVVDDLKISVERLLRDFSFGEDEDAAFEHVTAQLKACSPEAQELVRQLHQRHLTAEEMSMLMHPSKVGGPSNPAAELRSRDCSCRSWQSGKKSSCTGSRLM